MNAWLPSLVSGPSVGDPASESEADITEPLGRSIVVEPAEGFGFFEKVDVVEVLAQFMDEFDVDFGIEGIGR